MAVIEVENLKKSFSRGFIPKKIPVLHGVSFHVQAGRITGFLGGNGAGKTTTLKCILGLIFPDEGRISILGKSSQNLDVRKEIGFLPERAYFYEHLTGEEFLRFHGQLSGKMKPAEIADRSSLLLKKLDLEFARHKRLRQYSKGMLQKMGVAQAILHRPSLVILDEPLSGLDPDGRYYVNQIIQETCRDGAAVFFSSHLLPDVEKVSQDLVILREGQLLFSGALPEFLSSVDQSFVIKFWQEGQVRERRLSSQAEVQSNLRELLEKKLEIIEVNPTSLSLEEVFISRAQKVKS